MSDMPKVIWARKTSGWGSLERGVYQNAEMDGYEYIRKDASASQSEIDAVREENMRLREALSGLLDHVSGRCFALGQGEVEIADVGPSVIAAQAALKGN